MVPDSCLSVVMVSGTGLVIVRSEKFVLKALTPPFLSLDSGSHFFLLHPPPLLFLHTTILYHIPASYSCLLELRN